MLFVYGVELGFEIVIVWFLFVYGLVVCVNFLWMMDVVVCGILLLFGVIIVWCSFVYVGNFVDVLL